MPLGYYCERCEKFVLTRLDMFQHGHLGMKSLYVCRHCGGVVYLKEQGDAHAV